MGVEGAGWVGGSMVSKRTPSCSLNNRKSGGGLVGVFQGKLMKRTPLCGSVSGFWSRLKFVIRVRVTIMMDVCGLCVQANTEVHGSKGYGGGGGGGGVELGRGSRPLYPVYS